MNKRLLAYAAKNSDQVDDSKSCCRDSTVYHVMNSIILLDTFTQYMYVFFFPNFWDYGYAMIYVAFICGTLTSVFFLVQVFAKPDDGDWIAYVILCNVLYSTCFAITILVDFILSFVKPELFQKCTGEWME